jgi:spore coat polysaccharide biosynthesis protein SpsF (cytidylyltransferase family)
VPNKPLVKYAGKPHIEHLVDQLMPAGYPVYLCVPENEVFSYSFLVDKYPKRVKLFSGYEADPLARQFYCAKENNIKNIIRVTHDKIFVDIDNLPDMLKAMEERNADYVYSPDFIAGTQFELISFNALSAAASKFLRVEHISYAIKSVTDNVIRYKLSSPRKDIRLLVDYPEDVKLMQVIYATLGADINLKDVIRFLDQNNILKQMNKLPAVTVYTCVKNGAKWIQEAMGSVSLQANFKDYEYILIDDFSNDKTLFHIAKFCQNYKNARFIRNEINVGLASSSNIALRQAKGNYIVRLDADDFFIGKNAVAAMVEEIEHKAVDAIYPNCYAGLSQRTIQKGNEHYHVGGTLFRTSALNHIKFTDNLRNCDSLDVFTRAKDKIKIGLLNKTVFCYRQHNESMSKNNLLDREKTRRVIESKYV